MLAESSNYHRKRLYGHKNDSFVLLLPLKKLQVQAIKVGKVVRNHGAAVGRRPAQMLFVRDLYVAFEQRMGHIVPALRQRLCDMDIHVFVKVKPNA
jgi:hypothetical protein